MTDNPELDIASEDELTEAEIDEAFERKLPDGPIMVEDEDGKLIPKEHVRL